MLFICVCRERARKNIPSDADLSVPILFFSLFVCIQLFFFFALITECSMASAVDCRNFIAIVKIIVNSMPSIEMHLNFDLKEIVRRHSNVSRVEMRQRKC